MQCTEKCLNQYIGNSHSTNARHNIGELAQQDETQWYTWGVICFVKNNLFYFRVLWSKLKLKWGKEKKGNHESNQTITNTEAHKHAIDFTMSKQQSAWMFLVENNVPKTLWEMWNWPWWIRSFIRHRIFGTIYGGDHGLRGPHSPISKPLKRFKINIWRTCSMYREEVAKQVLQAPFVAIQADDTIHSLFIAIGMLRKTLWLESVYYQIYLHLFFFFPIFFITQT